MHAVDKHDLENFITGPHTMDDKVVTEKLIPLEIESRLSDRSRGKIVSKMQRSSKGKSLNHKVSSISSVL